jgi:metal iron transporter
MGATVMPHSLFLGSALATQDRITFPSSERPLSPSSGSSKASSEISSFRHLRRSQRTLLAIKEFLIVPFRTPPPSAYSTRAQRHGDRENRPFDFVKAHIYHGTVDIMLNLLGFAVLINSMFVCLPSLWKIL